MSVNEVRVCNRQTSTKASSFYKLLAFYFIANLVITRSVLDLTLPVTELLQGEEIDMADVSHLLDSLKSVILSKRNTVGEFHDTFYRIILEIANKVSINETKSRRAAFQINRNNVPSESVYDYFRKDVTIPLLDHLLTQLHVRFDSPSVMEYDGLVIVPLKMLSLYHKYIDWRQTFRHFEEFYKGGLSCFKALEAELDLWEAY